MPNIDDLKHNIYIETKKHYEESTGLNNVNNVNIEDKLERCLLLPIAPQEIMYKSSSSPNNLTLLNTGDISAGMTKKLDEWTVTSIFPSTNTANLPYVIKSNGVVPDPYDYFCATLYYWKMEEVPLVFRHKTWGNFYCCLIKDFEFGVKDNTGDVWYTINFQEYRGADIYGVNTKIYDYTPKISDEYYYPSEGEDLIHLCQTVYGSSDAYRFFMQINGMVNIELKAGQAYKIRR